MMVLTSLALLPFIAAGVASPCAHTVCFHVWRLSTGPRVAIVTNGKILRDRTEDECTVTLSDLRDVDVGRHRCGGSADGLPAEGALREAPVLNLVPGKSVSYQCVTFRYLQRRGCGVERVALWWVDESGEKIESDTEHLISASTSCNVTLTVTLQSPQTRTFRCRASVGQEVQTSATLQVKVPDRNGRRRRGPVTSEGDGGETGNSQLGVSVTVGVLGCVALMAAVALIVKRRRKTQTLPGESTFKSSVDEVGSSDEVVYADIVFPVAESRLSFLDSDSTVYANVRYK